MPGSVFAAFTAGMLDRQNSGLLVMVALVQGSATVQTFH
jgi:hypothetical protein